MTDAEIDKVLGTAIPGGSAARDWFMPHDTKQGLQNVRNVVRRMLDTAARLDRVAAARNNKGAE